MTSAELTALLVLCAATSFTPGPNTTLSAALGANLGWRRALRFVVSVPVGWGLVFLFVAAQCAGRAGCGRFGVGHGQRVEAGATQF